MSEAKDLFEDNTRVSIRVRIDRKDQIPIDLGIVNLLDPRTEDFLYTDYCRMSNLMMDAVRTALKDAGVRI